MHVQGVYIVWDAMGAPLQLIHATLSLMVLQKLVTNLVTKLVTNLENETAALFNRFRMHN